jgi:Zinc carboxypeptidase
MHSFRRLSLASLVILLAVALVAPGSVGNAAPKKKEPPRTGFETRNGSDWTTHEEELEFLAEVDKGSKRVSIEVIGKTKEKRPLHLVKLGNPAPVSAAKAKKRPTLMFVCSQHGNEPAGRETCLQMLRNLAFTTNGTLVNQLTKMTILFVPSANPDGRAANTRENTDGIDINRDHLNLVTAEARAIAKVVRKWKPDVSLDLHEYGPSLPLLYDDEVLYLWPRNLNVDSQVHGLAKTVGEEYIRKDVVDAGYAADTYGMYAVADQDIHQSAGDGDEGIMRNAMGLRHSLGILVESAVTADPRNGPDEVVDESALNRRRVHSQIVVSHSVLRFMREQGNLSKVATDGAPIRKTKEGRKRNVPVYFGGADNQEPTPEQTAKGPCGYELTAGEFAKVRTALALHGVRIDPQGHGSAWVPMDQPAEPVIPLLLDARGTRHSVEGTAAENCIPGPVSDKRN